MSKKEEIFSTYLQDGARDLDLSLSSAQLDRLKIHFRELERWADRTNLTTVREPQAMAERLYLDSALPGKYLSEQSRVHDIGSGAGFPGLVLKALWPSLRVCLTEARRKKVSFLKQAARLMSLGEGLEIRWERLTEQEAFGGEQFDEVMSRAAFPPAEWLRLGAKLVAPGGRLWIFSGPPHGEGDRDEIEDAKWWSKNLPSGFQQEQCIPYLLPFSRKPRVLIALRRSRAHSE